MLTSAGLKDITLNTPLKYSGYYAKKGMKPTDSDDDGLEDWLEVDINLICEIMNLSTEDVKSLNYDCLPNLCAYETYCDEHAESLENSYEYVKKGIGMVQAQSKQYFNDVLENAKVLPIVSNPTKVDSDGDGIMDCNDNDLDKKGYYIDTHDTAPLSKGLEGGITGELTIISCDNPIAGHGFLIYRSYINDKFNFAKLTGGYEFGEWEFINTSTLTAYIYEMKPYDYVSIGNAGTHAMGGIGSSGSSGGGGLENSEDINDGDCGGMYFNREFAYDYLHYDGTDYKSGYSKNYSYTKAITSKGINEVIKCAKDNNYYNLPQHNCVHVAIISWNSVFPTDSFDEHTVPLGLKNEIKGRDGSRVFDILTEVFGF